MKGCFVTGTNTGVGKTLVAAALLRALGQHHCRVVGIKPVASGAARIDGQLTNKDSVALRAASNMRVGPELDNPFLLPDAVSPHIAAQRAGVWIDIGEIVRRYRRLAKQADFVVVEGAGGFHVPLTLTETGADLAEALALPVVLVVGLRTGCLNHALLTAESIRHRGLRIAGWVANRIDPALQEQEDNVDYLNDRLKAPLLADVPYCSEEKPRGIAINLPQDWTRRR